MRKVLLVGLIALVAMAGNCCPPCPPTDCEQDCPVARDPGSDDTTVVPKVDIVILPLPEDTTATCVAVEGVNYCAPGRTKKDFPSDSVFTINVDGEVYELSALSPDEARLVTVYIVVGSKYVVGVYADDQLRLAAEVGECVTCPNGATVCGHNPKCPR